MRRSAWILTAVALLAAAGCHKKVAVVEDAGPQLTGTVLAAGSTGDAMSQLATQNNIPIYPGAVPDTAHFNSSANSGSRIYLAYSTPDPPDRVVNFYKGQMGLSPTTSGAVTLLTGATANGTLVQINVGQKMDGSGTSFSIVLTPTQPQQYDNSSIDTSASNMSAAANAYQNPPEVAPPNNPVEQQDAPTYYVPTSRSAEDDGYVPPDDGSQGGDSGQSGDQTGGESQDQTSSTGVTSSDDNGPPGG